MTVASGPTAGDVFTSRSSERTREVDVTSSDEGCDRGDSDHVAAGRLTPELAV
jgi:hypothetical protein